MTTAATASLTLSSRKLMGNPVKTLLTMMRIFHYVVGITAPDKKHEKQILFVWIGVFIGLVVLTVLFTRFIISELIK